MEKIIKDTRAAKQTLIIIHLMVLQTIANDYENKWQANGILMRANTELCMVEGSRGHDRAMENSRYKWAINISVMEG
jgi:hypothetical protein